MNIINKLFYQVRFCPCKKHISPFRKFPVMPYFAAHNNMLPGNYIALRIVF